MKAIRTFIIGIMMLVGTSVFAQPMSYNAIRNNARFLTDRMAYTLGITNLDLIDDIYRINYDYIYGVNSYLDDIAIGYRYDDYMLMCEERDYALRMLLGDVIWSRLIGYDYFYRPIVFENRRWRFSIYAHDFNRGYYHYSLPRYYEHYRGGHYFGPMDRNRGIGTRGPGMVHIERRGNMPGGNPGMNRPDISHRGDVHRGGQSGGPDVVPNGRSNDNRSGNMTRPEVNRGGDMHRSEGTNHGGVVAPGGSMNRSESNIRSSSRGSYSERPSTRSNSSAVTRSSSAPNRSGNFGGSSSSSSSRGSSFGGGSRGGNSGGFSRSGNGGSGSHRR